MQKMTAAFLLSIALLWPVIAHSDDTAPIGTRADLFSPKYQAASFRHMDKLFPYHKVSRSGPVSELPLATRQLGEVHYQWSGSDRRLSDLLTRTSTMGFLVVKDGRIATERYFGGADQNSTFTSWSMGKSFTSTLLGLAIADGKIASVDDPVTKYLPELKGSGYDGVPIKYILEMSSGVQFNEEYTNAQSDIVRMWVLTMAQGSETLSDFLKTIPAGAQPPGSKFVYRSADTQVLGMLVIRVTGETLADDLTKRIWGPLGMERDATWLTDKSGMEAAYCCINATIHDYARFGLLFLNDGKWNGKQLVPASWVKEATTPQSPQVQAGKLFPHDPGGYGYQWWTYPNGVFSAEGVNFQFIYVNPKENLVIAKNSALPEPWDVPLQIETFVGFDAITRALHQQ
jgi:CubicO group peptidase (beta-lactamase class C family)